jgi:hypothetical protein
LEKNYGITAYVPERAILKEMAAKIKEVNPAFLFFSLVRKISDRPP